MTKPLPLALHRLPTFDDSNSDEEDHLNVIIETPQGSSNKFNYDEDLGLFRLAKVMPKGSVFPFDFGFVPSTLGEDGDPMDVLVLMDAAVFTGCLVTARLIGSVEAEQTEHGETTRNDRLLAVAVQSRRHRDVQTPSDLAPALLEEIEHFFRSYNEQAGKQFKVLGRAGPTQAKASLQRGVKRFKDR